MNTSSYKTILIASLILFFLSHDAYSKTRKCEIKYGIEKSKEELENDHFPPELDEEYKNKYSMQCYQIGVEHDKKKQPLLNKPIYACCRNI